MSEEAIPQAAVVPPHTEPLPTRPDMEGAEIKGAAAAKEPQREEVTDENAQGVATSGTTTAPTTAVNGTIALLLSVLCLYSLANGYFLVSSQGAQCYKRQTTH